MLNDRFKLTILCFEPKVERQVFNSCLSTSSWLIWHSRHSIMVD
jgi:hypothetical protein